MPDSLADDETETSTNVGFRLEGKFIADLARTRLCEGAWERALSLLTGSLQGLTTDDAIAILKGEADLTGWSSDEDGVGLVRLPADGPLATEMREHLNYMYGKVFREGDRYYKPYATVLGWYEEDYRFSRRYDGTRNILDATTRSNRASYNPQDTVRSLFYAKDARRDLLVLVELSKIDQPEILCEQVSMPPFWYEVPHNNTAEVLSTALREGTLHLPQRGAHQYLPDAGESSLRSDEKPFLCVADENEESPATNPLPEPTLPATKAAVAADSLDNADAQTPSELTAEEQAALDALSVAQKALKTARADAAARRLMDAFSKGFAACTDRGELGRLRMRFEAGVAKHEREMSVAMLDERDKLLSNCQALYENLLKAAIVEQADANGGWYELKLVDSDERVYRPQPVLRVPRNPFMLWALRGVHFEDHGHERPAWTPVAPSGLKMVNDDVMHTDWMLGAGLSLEETYDRDDGSLHHVVRSCAFNERSRLVREHTHAKFVTLAKGPHSFIRGRVVHARPNEAAPAGSIVVVPSAGPEYQIAMETACRRNSDGDEGVLICETGGKLAHLATVGRELKCTVLMLPGALTRMRPGSRWFLNLTDGELSQSL